MNKMTQEMALRGAVAAELRSHMARGGVTQEQLAKMIGTTGPVVNRYMTGKRDIPMRTMVAMCDALGVDTGRVIDDAIAATHRTH